MCHAISRIGRVRTLESTPLNMSFGLGYEIKPNVCATYNYCPADQWLSNGIPWRTSALRIARYASQTVLNCTMYFLCFRFRSTGKMMRVNVLCTDCSDIDAYRFPVPELSMLTSSNTIYKYRIRTFPLRVWTNQSTTNTGTSCGIQYI